ncbi:MAG: hypothetical protein ACLGI5_07930 [Thermoleophilia bacterium]
MSYLQCRRCGLQIKIQAPFLRVENCPRCLGRTATVSPLQHSAEWLSPATRSRSGGRGDRSDQQSMRGS